MIIDSQLDHASLREKAEIHARLDLLDAIYDRIANRVIRKLRKLDYDLMSGEDSGLKSFWDEYCVQIQGEASHQFEVYESTLQNYLLEELNNEPIPIRNFYYVFSAFQDEDYAVFALHDKESKTHSFSYDCPINVSVYPLLMHINKIAAEYSNKRISKYLD